MTRVIVRATAVRWAADDFPGWIEVDLVDAAGRSHRLIEMVPVLTNASMTATSPFPIEMWLQAEFEGMEGDTALVRLLDGVPTTESMDLIGMSAGDVGWL